MNTTMIQMPDVPYSGFTKKFTLCEQDSDSKYYDETAAKRVCEREYLQNNFEMSEALSLSRTRIEFSGEHFVWADSPYLKSLGNEDAIFSKFITSQEASA